MTPRSLVAAVLLALMSVADAQSSRFVAQAALSAILAEPLAAAPAGNPHADVTVIEYFDYNCPVCREMEPQLRQLLASDPGIRLVRKDWAIFGDASRYAAYCSFAAAREGRYAAAHDALIGSQRSLDTREDVRQAMKAAGFDVKRIEADIALHGKEYAAALARNQREAVSLGLRGTPGVIVGDQLLSGGLDHAQLEQLAAQARRAR